MDGYTVMDTGQTVNLASVGRGRFDSSTIHHFGRDVTKKRWSAMEMAYLQDSWEKDVPIEAIAGHLKRTESACREKLHRMAIRRAVGQWLR
jgi:hypothetical protein